MLTASIRLAPVLLGDPASALRVDVSHADQLDVRHVRVDSCVKTAEITYPDDPDTQRFGRGGGWHQGVRASMTALVARCVNFESTDKLGHYTQ
jgi:hypothetical protein